MIEKPTPRTQTPEYFFSAGKAAESRKRRKAERQPAKLPTSLTELVDRGLRYNDASEKQNALGMGKKSP